MSARGREMFDRYVADYLNQPLTTALSLQSHVHTLLSHCREAGISRDEIIEEVGEIIDALTTARKKP